MLCASSRIFLLFFSSSLFVCLFTCLVLIALLCFALLPCLAVCQGALQGRSLNEAVSTGEGGRRERETFDVEEARELQSRVLELEEQVRRRTLASIDRPFDRSINE